MTYGNGELSNGGWIPLKIRPMTEEEMIFHSEWIEYGAEIFDCPLPEDGQEVLVSCGGYVCVDTFCEDDGCYGCYFEGVDIEDVDAWMPLPKPLCEIVKDKTESKDDNMKDLVYFELNNWFSGRDYPDAEPFTTWCGDDLRLYFCNEDWVKENKLVVVCTTIDMSVNWCITAPREWVENNCPKLLSDESIISYFIRSTPEGEEEISEEHFYSDFLRHPDEYGDVEGRFGTPFLEYSEENIGIHYWDDDEDNWYEDDEEEDK